MKKSELITLIKQLIRNESDEKELLYDEEEPLNESPSSGLMMKIRNPRDVNKVKQWLDTSDYSADYNGEYQTFTFPEDEETYDALESDLRNEMEQLNVDASFEGIFNEMSTSGGAGAYDTPKAFGKQNKSKYAKNGMTNWVKTENTFVGFDKFDKMSKNAHKNSPLNKEDMKRDQLKKIIKEIISENSFNDMLNMYPADLVKGQEYIWHMGAEPLVCTFLGKGEKPMTYKFQLDKSTHTLSYGDVRKYIFEKHGVDESKSCSKTKKAIKEDVQEFPAEGQPCKIRLDTGSYAYGRIIGIYKNKATVEWDRRGETVSSDFDLDLLSPIKNNSGW